MEDKIRVEFEMEQKMCNTCKKSSSEYYELKVQIRFVYFNNGDLDVIKNNVLKVLNSNFNCMNKIEYVPNGIDIFLSSYGEMNKVIKLFRKRYFCEEKRSKKIVGHDFQRSVDIWRYTQLISIINLNIGDKITIKGINYVIKAFNNNDLVLNNIIDGSKKVISYSIVKDYIVID